MNNPLSVLSLLLCLACTTAANAVPPQAQAASTPDSVPASRLLGDAVADLGWRLLAAPGTQAQPGNLALSPWSVAETLGTCRTLVVDSENELAMFRRSQNRPRRGQFLPDSPPHSPTMGQEAGEKWTGAADLQPTIPKSDRLLGMLHAGARGPTGEEIAKMLGGLGRPALGPGFADARAHLAGLNAATFTENNALWLSRRFNPRVEYQAELARYLILYD